jgi:formylglycine-generating enzyme required for sulfatase activity
LLAAALACLAVPVHAETIFSDSFENPDTTGRVTNSPAGWVSTRTDKTGINDASVADKTGSQFAFVDDYPNTGLFDGALTTTSEILSSNLTAWVNYTLTCDVTVSGAGGVGVIDLLAGTNVIASVTNAPATANDFSSTNHALKSVSSSAKITIIPADSHPFVGQPLAIRLRKIAGAWNADVLFDNLTLTAVDTTGDTNAPTPSVMLWKDGPVASANAGITMTASTASDPNQVEYCFTNTVNGHSSGWINVPVWTDSGLADGVSYSYKVKARDNSINHNETEWSVEKSAVACSSVLLYESFEAPPHADVLSAYATNSLGWIQSVGGAAGLHDEVSGKFTTPFGSQAAYVYDDGGVGGKNYSITNMGAVLEAGKQYLLSFNAASENGGNAGYGVDLLAGTNVVASATGAPGTNNMAASHVTISFTPTPDNPNLGKTIGIRLRKPTGGWSQGHILYDNILLIASNTSSDVAAPVPDPLTWFVEPVAIADSRISMIAATAADQNGVQYFFTNMVNGHTSGWQSSPGWTDTGLEANVIYSYRVKARDNSINYNETGWSAEQSVRMVPGTLFYDSFEAPPHMDVTAQRTMNSSGWVRTGTDDAGLTDVAEGKFATPYGSQAAYVYDNVNTLGHSYSTTGISDVLEAGKIYTLTFNAASENGGNAGYGVDLLAGTNVVATASGAPASSNMSATSVTIRFAPTPGNPHLGQPLGIRLRKPVGGWNQGQILYDNVRLTALPAGYVPLADGGGVTHDYSAAPLEVTVAEYVGYLNSMTNGELSVSGGRVLLAGTSNLLCLATAADPDAYVIHDDGAAMGSQYSAVTNRGNHPMIFVTWFGAASYCNWKSLVEGYNAVYNPSGGWTSLLTANGYRLPTEAEWLKSASWNALGNTNFAYGTSSDVVGTNDANFVNSGDAFEGNAVPTTPVGSYLARSPYGMSDMSGNVSEWCNDLYDGSESGVDPHAIRGGGWGHPASTYGKVTSRYAMKPGAAANGLGFRIFRTVIWE